MHQIIDLTTEHPLITGVIIFIVLLIITIILVGIIYGTDFFFNQLIPAIFM